jgi:predicted transcriptional regulator
MQKPTLGKEELELLRFVADHAPASVGEVAEGFGLPRGLARTTVQTVMERLCKKGYLERTRERGMYRYAPPAAQEDVLRGLVRDFVHKMLAGSLSPFAAYLADVDEVSDAEWADLERQIERLRAKREEKRS